MPSYSHFFDVRRSRIPYRAEVMNLRKSRQDGVVRDVSGIEIPFPPLTKSASTANVNGDLLRDQVVCRW